MPSPMNGTRSPINPAQTDPLMVRIRTLAQGDRIAPVVVCLALFLAAPVFALLTWQDSYSFTLIRHLSTPVMVVEVIVILAGISGGFQLMPSLAALNPLTRFAAFAWAVAAFGSAILAQAWPGMALVLYGSSLLHGLFLLVCWRMFSTGWYNWRSRILTSLALGAAAYFLLVLALAVSQLDNPGFNWKNFGAGVSNVRQLGFYGLVLAGLCAGFLAAAPDRTARLAWSVLLTAGIWLTYLSGSRAALGALIAALSILVSCTARNSRLHYGLVVLACALIAAPLSYLIVPDPIWGLDRIVGRVLETPDSTDYSSGRMEIWLETLRLLGERPFIGHGEGQFRFLVQTSLGIYNHPHNALLQCLFQWGLAGTTALVLVSFRSVKLLRGRVMQAPSVSFPALGAASALVTMSTLEGSLYHVYPTMVVLLCAAVIASPDRNRVTGSSQPHPAG